MLAAKSGHINTIRVFTEAGANVNDQVNIYNMHTLSCRFILLTSLIPQPRIMK